MKACKKYGQERLSNARDAHTDTIDLNVSKISFLDLNFFFGLGIHEIFIYAQAAVLGGVDSAESTKPKRL